MGSVLVAGRYRLDALLGAGGMGQVHRAWDRLLHRHVALKLLQRSPNADVSTIASALHEARAAAALAHQNVVAVFDAGEHDGRAFVVMEYVEGHPLRAWIGDASLSVTRGVRWLAQVAEGLAAAHDGGLVHRDVKPDNVMVRTSDGVVKVLDFGIARVTRADEADALSGAIVGTPAYMAPEQLTGDAVDARADQWAWGVMAYELLTGSLPWSGTTAPAIFSEILSKTPPPPSSLARHLPAQLDELIARTLSKEPRARFPSMRAIVAQLGHGSRPPASSLHPIEAATTMVAMSTPGVHTPRETTLKLLDVPAPSSGVPDAVEAYEAALRAFHDSSWGEARAQLARAVSLDPKMAAAWLRLGIARKLDHTRTPADKVQTFRRAADMRRALSERDRALLHAWSGYVLAPRPDPVEVAQRVQSLVATFPGDAEVLLLASFLRSLCVGHDESITRRALEIDPEYADAWWLLARQHALLDHLDEALAFYDRVVELSPASADGRNDRALLLAELGRADEAESEARQALVLDPTRPITHEVLAGAVWERSRNLDALRELFARRDVHIEPTWGPAAAARSAAILAILGGSVDDAIGILRAAIDTLTPERAVARGVLTRLALEACWEADARREGVEIASACLAAVDATGTSFSAWDDPVPTAIAVLEESGALSGEGAERQRRRWIEAANAGGWISWTGAYAPALQRGKAAVLAASAMPALPPQPGFAHPTGRAEVGCALAAIDRLEDAEPLLSRATRTCLVPSAPLLYLRAVACRARVLAQTGDDVGAQAERAKILDGWGHARAMRTVRELLQ